MPQGQGLPQSRLGRHSRPSTKGVGGSLKPPSPSPFYVTCWQQVLLCLCLVCVAGWIMLNAVELRTGPGVRLVFESSESDAGLLSPLSDTTLSPLPVASADQEVEPMDTELSKQGLWSRRFDAQATPTTQNGGEPEEHFGFGCSDGISRAPCGPTDIVVQAEVRGRNERATY